MKPPKPPKQAIAIVLAAIVLVSIYFAIDYVDNLKKPPSGTYYGTIEANETAVSAEISGILTDISAPEGATVKAGQTVAAVRSDDAAADAAIQAIGADMADNQRKLSLESARSEQIRIQESILKQIDAQAAQARNASSKAASIASARDNDVKNAKIQVDDRKKAYDDLSALLSDGAVPSNQVDAARSAYDTAVNAYQSAKSGADAARSDLESSARQIESLAYQKEAATETLKILKSPLRPEEVENAALSAKQQVERLKLSETRLGKTKLVSLVGGNVERFNFDIGEFVPAGAKVAVIADTSKLSLRIYVSEKDLANISEGMKLGIRSTATGKEAAGKVVRIAGEAMFTPVNIVTVNDREKLVFEVKIEIENPDRDAFKAGMLVEARISGK